MFIVEVTVPQMGEGLREVLVLRLLKRPGDRVQRDEVIYAMETDKADMDVESPYGGILEEWLVAEGDVVAVGAPVARLRTASGAAAPSPRRPGKQAPAAPHPSARPPTAGGHPRAARPRRRPATFVSPRTRAYCRHLGISPAEMERIPTVGSTLTPQDVDRHLAGPQAPPLPEAPAAPEPGPPADYQDLPLSTQQRVFKFRLERSAAIVVPATMARPLEWSRFAAAVAALRQSYPQTACSDFEVFAYAVAQATRSHQRFRSILSGKDTVRRYHHVNLGIAVQRLDGELVTAVVPEADRPGFPDFVEITQARVARALEGEDQADASVQLLLSYVSAFEITDAFPVLVAPATAVVFLGAPRGEPGAEAASLGVTFDHRLINGAGAAAFLKSILERIEELAAPDAARRGDTDAGDDELGRSLEAMAPEERRRRLAGLLTERIAALLGRPVTEVDPREPLRNLGLNSRLALELTGQLRAGLGEDLPPTLVWLYPTVERLAAHLAGRGEAPPAEAAAAERGPQDAERERDLLGEIERLSDDEAQQRLAERMNGEE